MGFSALLKKELLDGLRNYRFLIIILAFLFFALMNPVMNKLLLPEILKSQLPNLTDELLYSLLTNTQVENIRAYFSDTMQLSTFIIALTLAGMVAQEISMKTFLLPVSSGIRFGEIVLSKYLVYVVVIFIGTIVPALVNYLYAGVLYGFQLFSTAPVLRGAILQGFYMAFVLSVLMLFGTVTRRALSAGLLTLLLVYAMPYAGSLLKISRFLPSALIGEIQALAVIPAADTRITLAYTVALSVLFVCFTVLRLSKTDLSRG